MVGVVVVVIALAVAVLKPWAGQDSDVASATARPSASAGIADPPAVSAGPRAAATTGTPIAWARASAASRPHATWGVRAIVLAAKMEDPGFAERWAEASQVPSGPYGPRDPDVGNATRWAAAPPTAGVDVLALGLTFPPDELPLDVRVLGASATGWTWLDTTPLDPSPAVGAVLFAPPRIGGAPRAAWPVGAYRFQILLADSIREMDVDLADRAGVVSDPVEVDPLVPDPVADTFVPDLADPFVADLGPMGMGGPFTVERGLAIPWPASIGSPTDGAAVWRSAYGIDDAGLDRLPAIYAPAANGLGYVFPTGATAAEADLLRILPAGPLSGVRRAVGLRTDDDSKTPYAIFRSPDGQPWPAGIYRIILRWTDDAGSHTDAVHLDMHPGPLTAPPTILGSLPGLAWAAGRDVAVGGRAAGALPVDLACPGADEAVIVTDPPVAIGIGHGPGAVPATVTAHLLVDDLPPVEQPLLMAREPVPGLTVLAPATGAAFAAGRYRLTFEGRDATTTMDICPGLISAP
jgi:hypothetical protein